MFNSTLMQHIKVHISPQDAVENLENMKVLVRNILRTTNWSVRGEKTRDAVWRKPEKYQNTSWNKYFAGIRGTTWRSGGVDFSPFLRSSGRKATRGAEHEKITQSAETLPWHGSLTSPVNWVWIRKKGSQYYEHGTVGTSSPWLFKLILTRVLIKKNIQYWVAICLNFKGCTVCLW